MTQRVRRVGRPKKGTRPEKSKSDEFGRVQIVSIRGSEEYDTFVTDTHEKTRIPKSEQFRIAYREWCERNGYGTPPPI